MAKINIKQQIVVAWDFIFTHEDLHGIQEIPQPSRGSALGFPPGCPTITVSALAPPTMSAAVICLLPWLLCWEERPVCVCGGGCSAGGWRPRSLHKQALETNNPVTL